MLSDSGEFVIMSRVATGSLCESFTHECLKSSLAFRNPAVAVASRRPARADAPKVGLDGPASHKPRRRASSPVRGAWARWAGSATSTLEAERQCLSRRLTVAFSWDPRESRRPSDC